jgi:hypothetical protein
MRVFWPLLLWMLCSCLARVALAQSGDSAPAPAATSAEPRPEEAASNPAPTPALQPPPDVTLTPPDADSGARAAMGSLMSKFQVHGFVSEGAFISTSNDAIGDSSRGSLKFFEAGINVSAQLTDRLRVGIQFVSRAVGDVSEVVPRLDWGFLDYRFFDWLGLRAGEIKMPLGLYNEYVSIEAARTAILLPQSLYPLRNRDALISHTGFALYGTVPLGPLGELSYQGWLGTLNIPRSALTLVGASLNSVDTHYVAGGEAFWSPLEGLRVGGTYLRASIDFHLTLDPASIGALVDAQLVPVDYDGKLVVSQTPTDFWVASLEYTVRGFLFAGEYSRWRKHQYTTLPKVLPSFRDDSERFYVLASYRFSELLEVGSYYSVIHLDANHRDGAAPAFRHGYNAYQRDLALSLRLDVNEYWLWKVEGHFVDGTADLSSETNTNPSRYWGLFLLRTSVTF